MTQKDIQTFNTFLKGCGVNKLFRSMIKDRPLYMEGGKVMYTDYDTFSKVVDPIKAFVTAFDWTDIKKPVGGETRIDWYKLADRWEGIVINHDYDPQIKQQVMDAANELFPDVVKSCGMGEAMRRSKELVFKQIEELKKQDKWYAKNGKGVSFEAELEEVEKEEKKDVVMEKVVPEAVDNPMMGNGFKTLLFNQRSSNRASMTDHQAKVKFGNKNHYICFNSYLSALIQKKNTMYVNIAYNEVIDELYLYFTKKEAPGSMQIVRKNSNTHLYLNSKAFVSWLGDKFGVKDEDWMLHISKDKSKKDDVVTVQVFGKSDNN